MMLCATGYVIGWLVIKFIFQWDYEDLVALTFNTGMRNISAGAVIAITFFPAPVTIPVISAMLIQQLLASFNGHMLQRLSNKEAAQKEAV
ncbi:hypothetical protein BKP37_14260 [Anaerobacillus alkalilacustris]|uniref:Bile acid:sodium symporter n=1 Tax=Anaerobacillus alkalilacustris TaxID=393763 RepID=A0A1S2LJ34_9BACI|nr:hypothetical protein [Anaerobacillus alkalilacustris]OIJ12240.1 hypothetical protein BKP37_14260 [Anaerobacillus alkalilacustris]